MYELQEDEDEEFVKEGICGCVNLPKPFDYNHARIPPEPNFFSAGFLTTKEDR